MVFPESKLKYPFCYRGHQYALDVISGKIVASIYVIGACKRYLKDIQDNTKYFYMDWDAAEKYLRLVQKFEHVIGKWNTAQIIYEPWQLFCWMNIMGFKNRTTGYRRFRIAHIEIARGNGKSLLASQCALYMLALDNPNGNQISTVATKKEQARIVLDASRAMAQKNPSYLQHTGVQVRAHTLVHKKSNSIMRALSSDHSGLDGLNDVLAICDELHAMSKDTFEVIYSGMSKRKDSLTLCITTAGQDVSSVGHEQSSYAKKVCLEAHDDDQFFAIVYTLDENDDWRDEKVWIKANPNLGISVDLETFRAKIEKAKITPSDVNNIKIKHLNIWISEANAFFDTKAWDLCEDKTIKLSDFSRAQCRLGIDLASHIDITSIGIVFRKDGKYYIFDKSFIPEETVENEKNSLYESCIGNGHLIKTKGAAINYEHIQGYAEELAVNHNVQECMYDAWNATETAQKLSNKIEMVKMAMNVANFSEPMKKLDSLIREGKVVHNGSPLLRWCLGNVVAKEDHNGNFFPRKSNVKLKIDPIVAILMALAGWIQDGEETVYEERGIRYL